MAPTNHENSVSTVPKSGARDITIVIRPGQFITLLVVTSVSAILLCLICLKVAPFFDKYQNLSEDLKALQANLTEIKQTSESLKKSLSEATNEIKATNIIIVGTKESISTYSSQIEKAFKSIDLANTQTVELLKKQEKTGLEINGVFRDLKNEQESISMINSQNNAIQSGITISIQRLKEVELQLQNIKQFLIATHRNQ